MGGLAVSFIERVKEKAQGLTDEEAHTLVRTVMYSLAQVMDRPDRELLARRLPELAAHLSWDVEVADPLVDEQVFVGPIVNELTTEGLYDQTLGGLDVLAVHTGDEATRRLQAVFAALKERLNENERRRLQDALPGDVSEWYQDA